jgi:hypothetical protein
VIKRTKVTEFVKDDIVRERWWQERDTIIEGQVPFPRAAPPTRFLIADTDLVIRKSIRLIEVCQSLASKNAGCFPMPSVLTLSTMRER